MNLRQNRRIGVNLWNVLQLRYFIQIPRYCGERFLAISEKKTVKTV